jgi:DNA-binding NarL/FixJ family response regulator
MVIAASFPVDTSSAEPKAVLVDVRPERRALVARVVDLALGKGTVVAEVATASEAVAAIDDPTINTAIVEMLPVAEGLSVIASLRAARPDLRIVVCTFHDGRVTREQAAAAGVDVYLVKPASARELRDALRFRRPSPAP